MSTIRVDELRALSDNDFSINVSPNDNFEIQGTIEFDSGASFAVPVGTSAQSPTSPVGGMLYDGTVWQNFIGSSAAPNGATEATAVTSVQALYDAGQVTDGSYWINFDGTARQYFVPLNSHPYYILVGNWGGGADKFLQNASALSGNQLNNNGDNTPTGNWANNGTYRYYRNTGGSDFKYHQS